MNTPDILAAVTPLIQVFEQLGIPYYIGGSVASSTHGIPRLTLDVDLAADIQTKQVNNLVMLLQSMYYIDGDMIRDAIRHHSSFNIIHLDTMLKIDVFLSKARLFDQETQRRVQQKTLAGSDRPFYMASPEDVILNKLEWYKMSQGVSDRQWNDILGVLKLKGTTLDFTYLRTWAAHLAVTDLLERAFIEAGLVEQG
ncbi:MAG: hypothetical protein M3Z08_12525 [Chloroflexota bacterium]|nr:hypothetical protein [Chloroflexota bacterium]